MVGIGAHQFSLGGAVAALCGQAGPQPRLLEAEAVGRRGTFQGRSGTFRDRERPVRSPSGRWKRPGRCEPGTVSREGSSASVPTRSRWVGIAANAATPPPGPPARTSMMGTSSSGASSSACRSTPLPRSTANYGIAKLVLCGRVRLRVCGCLTGRPAGRRLSGIPMVLFVAGAMDWSRGEMAENGGISAVACAARTVSPVRRRHRAAGQQGSVAGVPCGGQRTAPGRYP